VWLSQAWSGWRLALVLVKPDTCRGVPDLRAQAALASLEAAVGRHDAARTIVSRIAPPLVPPSSS
jgi:hypothetical protein